MKNFKYIIIIGILAIFLIVSKYGNIEANVLADNASSVMYNNVEVKNNSLDLEDVILDENKKIDKKTVDFTNTTKEELKLSKDNLQITSKCEKIKIDVYFSKGGNNFDELVLTPTESAKINVVFSYEDSEISETCDYNIALNIGANI